MKARALITAAILCLASSMAWSGTVYKWTDAKGQVHFGDQAPDGVKSEKMSIDTGTAEKMANPGLDNGSNSPSATEGSNGDSGSKNPSDTAAAEAQRKKNCEIAKKNLQVIETHGRIRVKEKSGKYHYLSPKEIQAQKTEYEKVVKQSCGPSADK